MATATKSSGECRLCGKTTGKGQMTRHLQACLKHNAGLAGKGDGRAARPVPAYHVLVEGRHDDRYWLHLLLRADARLSDLDAFLRAIWLECCGHMSMFTINGRNFVHEPYDADDRSMSTVVGDALHPGLTFFHDYDMGTTTCLKLKVASLLEAPFPRKAKVRLIAQNHAPEFACCECGEPATQLCTECMYDGRGPLCA